MKWIFAVIFPPLGVAFAGGGCGSVIVNLMLCCCGYFPGMLHAFLVCAKTDH